MKISSLRLPLAAFSILVATAVSAEEIELALLQCAPLPPLDSSAVAPTCPTVANEMVVVEDCSCPAEFQLVRLTAPASIVVLEAAAPISQ